MYVVNKNNTPPHNVSNNTVIHFHSLNNALFVVSNTPYMTKPSKKASINDLLDLIIK